MLEGYVKYLKFLDSKLSTFFESQSPFIFCQKGCAKCCKNAQFPYSATEMQYLLKKKTFKGKKFLYDCPFLIDDVCSVYEYRGVLCRTFGLMTKYDTGKLKAPFCTFEGLNYSNVLNLSKRTVSVRKYKKLDTKKEPLGFNISYHYLTDPEFEKTFNFCFGDKKPLIEWFL